MKDKNGKDIIVNHNCLIDGKSLGVVRDIKENPVILMLKENPAYCYEEEINPDRIVMI